MAYGIELRAEVQDVIAAGSIGANYSPIGTAFEHKMRLLIFQNLTDATLQFSFDGVNDHFPLLSNGTLIIDLMTNSAQPNGFFSSIGTSPNVKRIGTPTTGSVYLSAFYAKGD